MNSKSKLNLILKVERPAHRGMFIGRHNGKVVMINGATMPGETVEVIVDEDKKDYFTASVANVLEPSPDRIQPPCSYAGRCGGCQLQHIPYELQVQLKEEILRDSLKRIAKIETGLYGPVINDDPWNYRLRGQFKVSPGGLGLHKAGTRDIVETDRCLLMRQEINDFIPEANRLLKDLQIKEFHMTSGDSLIAQIIARKNFISSRPNLDRLAEGLIAAGLSGVAIKIHEGDALGFGKSFITLELDGLSYTVGPQSFIQNNWGLNQKVVQIIKQTLHPLTGLKILDMYAGAGNFSLPLAMHSEVTAIERSPSSIEDGTRNMELNNIHFRIICSSAEKFRLKEKFDVVILDPPRPGLTGQVMKKVLQLKPGRIVYVSCNPSTLARDLKKLLQEYDLESIRMVDFFPQTYHIESLVFLRAR